MEYSFQVLPLGLSINKSDTKKKKKIPTPLITVLMPSVIF